MAACGRKSTLMISWSGRNQATGVSGDECGVAAEERGCVELDIHPVHNAVAIHVVSEVERIESGVGVGGGHGAGAHVEEQHGDTNAAGRCAGQGP